MNLTYVLKKIISLVFTLLLTAFTVFAAFTVIPGDPVTTMLGTQATPEKVAALREELGLDRPFLMRFFDWMKSFADGTFGDSYSYHVTVRSMLSGKLPITLTMTAMAFVLILLISIPLGVFLARNSGKRTDRIMTVVNQAVMAFPPFFSGILLTLFFGLTLHLFTPGGYVSYTKSVPGFLGYLIFPAIAIALPKAAMATNYLKASVLKELKMDYVRTAYSRGNTTKGVLYGHVLRNAIIPVITFLGMTFTDMIAGSIIIEQVFSIPGIGRLLISSIANRDYPVVEAIVVMLAFLVILTNFAIDLIYHLVDPRIRTGGEE